ncbi:hypothetical protein FRC09_012410, partial [Ceratobasidium sp. 395]
LTLGNMKIRGALASVTFWSFLSHASVFGKTYQTNPTTNSYSLSPLRTPIYRRQVPVVVAPPAVTRPTTNIPSVPQPTSSLNYWWPYGSNGVDPTVTAIPTSPMDSPHNTSVDDSTSSDTAMDENTASTTSSSTDDDTSTTTTSTATEIPSETSDPTPKSNFQGFKVISLLPLFIILGVLSLATFLGWTYGRCARWCQNRKEPVPGGPSIGGRPYESGGYDSDTIGPMRSAGIGWVDASRIHEHYEPPAVAYHAIWAKQQSEEPGTPSKSKARASDSRGWFRHTFSRKRPNENSPSGEKGLHYSSVDDLRIRMVPPALTYGQLVSQRIFSSPSNSESPKLLRVVNGSPSTMGNGAQSPTTSAQPTPYMPASRHGSIRRKLMEKVQADDEEDLLIASMIPGAFRNIDADEPIDNLASFQADPLVRSPGRRFKPDGCKSPQSLTRSPDPQEHRARMRRLRATAQTNAALSDAVSPSTQTLGIYHPLPPAPEVLLSPPLQPRLFFTESDQDSAPSTRVALPVTARNRSDDLSGPTEEASVDDPFGRPITPSIQPMRRTKAQTKSLGKITKSTGTAPLSPELRDAAMTRFEEIVKTNWSMRNLAEMPQSPTLFGAMSPSSTHGFCREDKDNLDGTKDMSMTR